MKAHDVPPKLPNLIDRVKREDDEAAIELIRESGGEIVASAFIVDLPDLGGSAKLRNKGIKVHTLVEFEGD